MSYVSDAHRFRKTMAGLCMIGAPVLFAIASITAPGLDPDPATAVGLIAADASAFGTAQLLALAGWGLFLCAAMAMMHMLREKGATEGHVGGALAVTGTLAAIAQCGFGIALWQVTENDPAAAASLLTGLGGVAEIALFVVPLGVAAGTVVFGWSLYRHHFVPAWMAAMIGGAGISFAIGSLAYSQTLYIAASALGLAGLGALGTMVLNESVEDWEHTPKFHGLGISAR